MNEGNLTAPTPSAVNLAVPAASLYAGRVEQSSKQRYRKVGRDYQSERAQRLELGVEVAVAAKGTREMKNDKSDLRTIVYVWVPCSARGSLPSVHHE